MIDLTMSGATSHGPSIGWEDAPGFNWFEPDPQWMAAHLYRDTIPEPFGPLILRRAVCSCGWESYKRRIGRARPYRDFVEHDQRWRSERARRIRSAVPIWW